MSKQENNKENVFVPPKTAYFVRCPYDNRHFVLNQNFEAHLVKCKLLHPNVHVLFCPFNTSHRCRSLEQLSVHIEKCPFQESFGQYTPKEGGQ